MRVIGARDLKTNEPWPLIVTGCQATSEERHTHVNPSHKSEAAGGVDKGYMGLAVNTPEEELLG